MRGCAVAVVFGLASVAAAAPVPKPTRSERVVSTPAKDVHVVTDRNETVQEYFNRTRLAVGSPHAGRGSPNSPGVDDLLDAAAPLKLFVSWPAWNDRENKALFGAEFRVAPPTSAVAELLKARADPKSAYLIFRADDDGVYHVVGYATRGIDFLGLRKKTDDDDSYDAKAFLFTADGK